MARAGARSNKSLLTAHGIDRGHWLVRCRRSGIGRGIRRAKKPRQGRARIAQGKALGKRRRRTTQIPGGATQRLRRPIFGLVCVAPPGLISGMGRRVPWADARGQVLAFRAELRSRAARTTGAPVAKGYAAADSAFQTSPKSINGPASRRCVGDAPYAATRLVNSPPACAWSCQSRERGRRTSARRRRHRRRWRSGSRSARPCGPSGLPRRSPSSC